MATPPSQPCLVYIRKPVCHQTQPPWPSSGAALRLLYLSIAIFSVRNLGFLGRAAIRNTGDSATGHGRLHSKLERLAEPSSNDQDIEALLAQAEALRREAALEEEQIRATKEKRLQEEAIIKAEEAQKEEEQKRASAVLAEAQLTLAKAKLAKAEAELEAALAAGGVGEKLTELKHNIERAKADVSQRESRATAKQSVSSPKNTTTNSGATSWQDVKLNYRGKVMTEPEWADLASRFENMSWPDQFSTNSRLGPQGRRKLAALRKGEKGGVFILPGERVRLLQEPAPFRKAFQRFEGDKLNGYNDEKNSRRGQECIIEATFNDKTLTCVFLDGTRFDLPFESITGYKE